MDHDKLKQAIQEKAKYYSEILGVRENVAVILMYSGITIQYDINVEENLLDMAAKELKLREEHKI